MTATILVGDVRAQLATLAPASVSLCITSPPFFGLRRYDTAPQVWGAPADGCDHVWGETHDARKVTGGVKVSGQKNFDGQPTYHLYESAPGACCACGAWRGELGSEPDVASFCAHLVEVFDAVRRVLHPTAVLAVELGDSYSGSGKGPSNSLQGPGGQIGPSAVKKLGNRNTGQFAGGQAPTVWTPLEMPALNLLMVPFRFALAMQDAGWLLRSVMPFVRRNAMPESVSGSAWVRHRIKGDDGLEDCPGCAKCSENDGLVLRMSAGRPSSAVSYVFLFAQQARYFWDSESVRVGFADSTANDARQMNDGYVAKRIRDRGGRSDGFTSGSGLLPSSHGGRNMRNADLFFASWQGLLESEDGDPLALIVNPQPLSDKRISRGHVGGGTEHFASWPEKLVEPLIRAGSSEAGCCSRCHAPMVRVKQTDGLDLDESRPQAKRALDLYRESDLTAEHLAAIRAVGVTDVGRGAAVQSGTGKNTADMQRLAAEAKQVLGGYYREFLLARATTTGWRPSCACEAPTVPALVLDPFSGSGTSLLVSERLGRDSVGIELSEAYSKLAKRRLYGPLFSEMGEAG